MQNAAVFLDKDGTLIEDVPYNVDPQRVRLLPGAAEGLRLLAEAGFRLIVVSNQPGVAHGYFPEEALLAVKQRLGELLADAGIGLAGFYYCPHHPAGNLPGYTCACECRKPQPGLLMRAAATQQIDLPASWLVGDILNDVEAGRRAGCRTVLVNNGGETEWELTAQRIPHFIVGDLEQAARVILANVPSYRADAAHPELLKTPYITA